MENNKVMILYTHKFKMTPEILKKFTEEISIPDVLYDIYIWKAHIILTKGLYLILNVAALLDLKGHIRINYFKENKNRNEVLISNKICYHS